MFRKICLLALTVVMLLSTLSLAACTKSDCDAIKDVVRSFFSAWNSRNFDRMIDLFSSDVEAYADYMIAEFEDAREEAGKITIKNMEEPVITDSMATIWVEVESENEGSDYFEIPLVKEDNKWKLLPD